MKQPVEIREEEADALRQAHGCGGALIRLGQQRWCDLPLLPMLDQGPAEKAGGESCTTPMDRHDHLRAFADDAVRIMGSKWELF
jgi:hypothetical protein